MLRLSRVSHFFFVSAHTGISLLHETVLRLFHTFPFSACLLVVLRPEPFLTELSHLHAAFLSILELQLRILDADSRAPWHRGSNKCIRTDDCSGPDDRISSENRCTGIHRHIVL